MKISTFSPKTNVSEIIIGIKPACFKKRYIIVDETGYKKRWVGERYYWETGLGGLFCRGEGYMQTFGLGNGL